MRIVLHCPYLQVVKSTIQAKGYWWPKAIKVRSRTAEVAVKAGLPRYPPAGWQGTNLHLICPFEQMPEEGEEHCNFSATPGAPEGGLLEIDTVLVAYMPKYLYSIATGKWETEGLNVVDATNMYSLIDPTFFDWPVPLLYVECAAR